MANDNPTGVSMSVHLRDGDVVKVEAGSGSSTEWVNIHLGDLKITVFPLLANEEGAASQLISALMAEVEEEA